MNWRIVQYSNDEWHVEHHNTHHICQTVEAAVALRAALRNAGQ